MTGDHGGARGARFHQPCSGGAASAASAPVLVQRRLPDGHADRRLSALPQRRHESWCALPATCAGAAGVVGRGPRWRLPASRAAHRLPCHHHGGAHLQLHEEARLRCQPPDVRPAGAPRAREQVGGGGAGRRGGGGGGGGARPGHRGEAAAQRVRRARLRVRESVRAVRAARPGGARPQPAARLGHRLQPVQERPSGREAELPAERLPGRHGALPVAVPGAGETRALVHRHGSRREVHQPPAARTPLDPEHQHQPQRQHQRQQQHQHAAQDQAAHARAGPRAPRPRAPRARAPRTSAPRTHRQHQPPDAPRGGAPPGEEAPARAPRGAPCARAPPARAPPARANRPRAPLGGAPPGGPPGADRSPPSPCAPPPHDACARLTEPRLTRPPLRCAAMG